MTLQPFVRKNRQEIDDKVQNIMPGVRKDDRERELWVMNDESIYLWAKRKGAEI